MDPPQKSPEKPPLITPSASPPPRPSRFSHTNRRLPDAAPPLKKQRLVSTPHRATHDLSSSTTPRPQSPVDVQKEREASKLRLLDVWSSLAERYTRPLDEDDIVDIRTGEITQDRGCIRKSRKLHFGAIAAPLIGDEGTDGEGTDGDEEDEYDTDELDAFADTLEMGDAQSEVGLPPVSVLELADAQDLREFLEAERRRKELCGSEIEEEDDYSATDIQSRDVEVEDESAADLNPLLPSDAADTSEKSHSQSTPYVDLASEDELDNWDIDDSSVVYPVVKHDSDIEIIDGPTLGPPPSLPRTLTVPPTPGIKPYVLLTPSKSLRLEKSKAKKQNINVGAGQELDSFKDPGLREAVEKGMTKTRVDEPFETMITAKEFTSEDGKAFDTNWAKEKRQCNSSERKAHSEDPLAVVSLPVESPPQTDQRQSSSMLPPKPRLLNSRKDNQHETLRESSRSPRPSGSSGGIILNGSNRQSSMHRKRKKMSSSDDDENQTHTIPKIIENSFFKTKQIRRSPSRSHRPRTTPKPSVSASGSEFGDISDSEREYSRKPAPSHFGNVQFHRPYPYPHHHQPYTPRRKQHPPSPHEMFAPPLPDPRAQFIITQAMQQLSALVGTPWTPPHDSPSIPYTPTRRHQSRQANNTPSHRPHPYPYSYDPNLSLATLPPESPEPASSPEKPSRQPRKSSMGRSRSRGRRVSFRIHDDGSSDDDGGHGRVDVYSSPSGMPSLGREAVRERGRQNITKTSVGKGKARAETPISGSGSEDLLDAGDEKSYFRGRTPGPNIVPPKGKKRGQDSQGRN